MAANNYQNAVAQNWVQGMFDVNKNAVTTVTGSSA